MARPTKPTVPPTPDRLHPDTFDERHARLADFFQIFANYLNAAAGYSEDQAAVVLAVTLGTGGKLSGQSLSAAAGYVAKVNSGGNAVVLSSAVNLTLATQTQAEGGTNNTAFMSPLRTKQAIYKFHPEPGWGARHQEDGQQ